MNNVIEFINNFKRDFDAEYLEHVFNNGNCYHFAVILKNLFGGVICYDLFNQHFVTLIDHNCYDINGKKPPKYFGDAVLRFWERLEETEPTLYNRVLHDCVYRKPTEINE